MPASSVVATPTRQRPIRVLLVDAHPVLRSVVREACEATPNLEVVGEEQDGEAAVAACLRMEPDVVVLDLALSGLGGFEVARRLRAEAGGTRILVVSGQTGDRALFECVRIGVDGFLGRSAGAQQITESIRRLAEDGRAFSADQDASARSQLGDMIRRAREVSDLLASLTPRERDVLKLISLGFTMRQVAKRLSISPRTVETHIAKLYRKLGVSSRVQAVARAASLGLIDLAEP